MSEDRSGCHNQGSGGEEVVALSIKYPLPVSPNPKKSFGTKLCLERLRPQVIYRQEKHKVFLHCVNPMGLVHTANTCCMPGSAPAQSHTGELPMHTALQEPTTHLEKAILAGI